MMEKLELSHEMEAAERAKLEQEIRAKQEEVQRIQSEVEAKDAEARRLQEEFEAAKYGILVLPKYCFHFEGLALLDTIEFRRYIITNVIVQID